MSVWSQDRIDELRRLYAKGISMAQIAAALGGLTRSAVIGKVHRLKLNRDGHPRPGRRADPAKAAEKRQPAKGEKKPPTDAMKAKLEGYRSAGMTGNEIAQALGCSRGQVVRLMRLHGLQGPARGTNGRQEPRHDVKPTTALKEPQRIAKPIAPLAPIEGRRNHGQGLHRSTSSAERHREGISQGAVDAVLSRGSRQCGWPLGDPRDPEFRFCCAPKDLLTVPYCHAHMRQAHQPADARRRTAA